MGILDTVLGRNFPTKKFENLLYEAIAELKYSMPSFGEEISSATSCVSRFLKDEKKHDKAYRKVNIVIKKQNHLDACNIIIGYLSLLIDNIDSFKAKTDIPVEHLEAVSGVIFAAPRIKVSSCFTAIQDVRKILLSHFGQNLVVQYLERNNCGINPQIIEKLSKKPSLREVRMKLLEEIAAKENIVLKLEEASTSTERTSSDVSKTKLTSERGKKKQIDVADAAQAAFESAAHAADAARAAVELLSFLLVERKKKQIDATEKALGSSSTSRENKKSEQKGNGDSSAKRGTKQKGKDKQADVAEKALGSSSNGPENKKSEQKGNEDGTAKEGKKKHTDVVGKSLGSPSNDPEKEKSEQECNDVTSESERRVVSDLEEDIKLDENFVELLEKDIEINWSVGDLEDVDHMVQLVGETADLRRPLSVRTRRVPEQ
ncbi:hypothetical protein Bca52824_013145 [Brassica carinata]|uniref:Uncharacterized protein n=1 Tax=Brassica carinata TaxID=52824 RepID=A0A8X8B3L8_BRACI|nr:hypothetical protein Bca52824_013145 [Brassica carinata]